MLKQTQKLKEVFSNEQINMVNNIIEEIEKEGQEYKTIMLWKFDQTIGGIGRYCQGCNPAHNPKVVSSSLTPATTEMPLLKQFTEDFLLLGKIHLRPLKTVKKH